MENILCDCETVHGDAVERVKNAMPDDAETQKLADFYAAFADRTRVGILCALSQESLCVCDLAALLGMTKSAISHQLKTLRLSRLVKSDRQGKVVFYSLDDRHIKDIFEKGFEHIRE